VLVQETRGDVVESRHRGHIVEVDQAGTILRVVGDAEHPVTLRSLAKPFGLVALIEAGGVAAFDLTSEDLALMASSHSGEDVHVRTLAALYRRAGVSQSVLACGTEGMPLDTITAQRLARDGERPGPLRHTCSGQHTAFVMHSKLRGWPLETYWEDQHPSQVAAKRALAQALGVAPEKLKASIDACGLPTFAVPLSTAARAFAFLAEPSAVGGSDARAGLAEPLAQVRDAMLAHPDLVGGSRDRLDTSLMKAASGRLVSKGGMGALRAIGLLPHGRQAGAGLAIKLEDGDGNQHALWSATVEALAQVGALDSAALRALGRYHRPPRLDPHGRTIAETVAQFDLAPVRELIS
jgi:L-asparaginase II